MIVSPGAYRPKAQMVVPPRVGRAQAPVVRLFLEATAVGGPHTAAHGSPLCGLGWPDRCAATHSSPGGLAQPTTQLLALERYFSNTAVLRLKFVLLQHHEWLDVCTVIIKLATIKCSHIP